MENGGNEGRDPPGRRAARGQRQAAKRPGEIRPRRGVPRDYAESQWCETARQLGETVETAGKR
jgi:hypothetical protein